MFMRWVLAYALDSGSTGTYEATKQRITEKNLKPPTLPEAALLLMSCWGYQAVPALQRIIDVWKRENMWGFTKVYWSRGAGVYVQDNPSIGVACLNMTEAGLEGRLGSEEVDGVVYSNDRTTRFTPYGFKTGRLTLAEMETNRYVRALFGDSCVYDMCRLLLRVDCGVHITGFSHDDLETSKTCVTQLTWGRPTGNFLISGTTSNVLTTGYALGIVGDDQVTSQRASVS
jgi:hypothetical protein